MLYLCSKIFTFSFPLVAFSLYIDTNNEASIRAVASTVAFGLMKLYTNNQSGTPREIVGTFPPPYYWWESGAVWGGMVDYWAYTGDESYVVTTSQALVANFGPDENLMMPNQFAGTGNDDQAFWALALMSAVESGFPPPIPNGTEWLDVAKACFESQAARWDTATCEGGLRWQIFETNLGYDYMNSISNGAFFQLAARLARFTGNNTYFEWAERTWNWCAGKNLITQSCEVTDGTDPKNDCADTNPFLWSYNHAVFLAGAAALYNLTNGSSLWQDRVTCLLVASGTFFTPDDNATDVMYEPACEPVVTCNTDQQSFKAYLGRWQAKAAVLAPYAAPAIRKRLLASARAAADSCSGGVDNVTCGTRWYVGGWDGVFGVGQQLSALEVVQGLLAEAAGPPATGPDVTIEARVPTSTLTLPPKTQSAVPTFRPDAPDGVRNVAIYREAVSLDVVVFLAPLIDMVFLLL